MPLASAPSTNIDLVASYTHELADWAGLFFVPWQAVEEGEELSF